jgi:hypothetical protein
MSTALDIIDKMSDPFPFYFEDPATEQRYVLTLDLGSASGMVQLFRFVVPQDQQQAFVETIGLGMLTRAVVDGKSLDDINAGGSWAVLDVAP